MPVSGTYANGQQLTVDAALKQPPRLSRELTALVNKRLVSRRLFVRGPAALGGSIEYERSQSLYMDATRDAETIAERAKWPRAGFSEDIRQAKVNQWGLEFPVSNLAIRRNRTDVLRRGMIKLGNTLAKRLDGAAMAVLEGDADIQSQAASAVWTTAGTDVIADLGAAQEKIETQDEGYDGFEGATLVLHTSLRDALLNNTVLRAALPRETSDGQIRTGMMAPFLGLREIIFTPRITQTLALLIDTNVAGTVTDEIPDAQEGWQTFNPDAAVDPIYTMVYEDKTTKEQIVAAGRWPAFFLTDPKAVVKITGVSA